MQEYADVARDGDRSSLPSYRVILRGDIMVLRWMRYLEQCASSSIDATVLLK